MTPALVTATSSDLRQISTSALALWRALVRWRRASDCPDDEWFAADLRHLMHRASIASYSTARSALAQLRAAGLVATSRCSSSRWINRSGSLETTNALEGNLYLVVGDYSCRGGINSYLFPRRAWTQFVEHRRSGIKTEVDPWSVEIQPLTSAQLPKSKSALVEHGFPCRAQELTRVGCTSVLYSIVTEEIGTSKKAGCKPAYFSTDEKSDQSIADLAGLDDESDPPPSTPTGILICGTAPPLEPPDHTGSTCPYLPPDTHEAPAPLVMYVSPEMVPEQKALAVIDGFRRAVREVYGQEWWNYSKGDLKRAKGYAGLVACGVQLSDHSAPADHWAIWRLRWFKSTPRFATKPPPIGVVMSARTVSERAGWFRKDYELPVPTVQHDPIIAEQHLRNREAAQRWRGLSPTEALVLTPSWYAAKRRAEISQGFDDPHDMWPTKPGSRYGRVAR